MRSKFLRFLVCSAVSALAVQRPLAPTPAFAEAPSQERPESSYLLLTNGEVLRGQLQRDGLQYKIRLTTGGVAVFTRAEIRRVEPSLRKLYEYQRDEVRGQGAPAHFKLAKWCLTQRYLAEASAHLAEAQRLHHDPESVHDLDARIKIAVVVDDRRRSTAAQPVSASPRPAAAGETAVATRFSPEAMSQFATRIQPLLVNRCGNAACHGRATQTAFQLTRHSRRGLYASQTRRNAAATEGLVDFASPQQSQLLTWSQKPHGGAHAAPLSQRQLAALTSWLATVTGREIGSKTARSTSNEDIPQRQRFSDAAPSNSTLPPQKRLSDASVPGGDLAEERESVDPFDPAVFNRLHHPKPTADQTETE